MNPIDIAFIATSAGCGAGMAKLLNLLRVAQDAAPAPVVEDIWDGEWEPMVSEVSEELKARQKVREGRVDTLHGIYLKQLGLAAEQPEEVPAR